MTLEDIYRQEWGQVVATLIRVTGDWELAEECAQEAFAAALQRWPVDGVPDRPGAWLTTTARNRAVDWLRREAVGAAKLRQVAALEHDQDPPYDVPDDRLRLMFTCCHPALAMEARVALTLRTLAGLSTAEIARAFLVPETTMSKRLTRAKQKIQHAHIPYRVPPAHLLPQRTPAVLAVLYLLFNEGYSDVVRSNLSGEAIRLARLLVQLMPSEPEAGGLLALMLLHDARRDTRLADDGALITLDEQDRSRWDHGQIKEGVDLLDSALDRGAPGPYQIQAAIAACHATARTAGDTDWPQVAALYARLPQTPVVTLNRAVAIGMADGPAVGLRLVQELAEGPLAGYHLLPATRADFLRRLERWPDAKTAYEEALELATTDAERLYLQKRLREVSVRS
ncbi:RNA polymerase sigma factor [Kribbella pratensis]|uniref:RNA polymerase sigma-70 factor (ECF subfamily) n=1 Tax=Kribbella pratensis TaxID=2512112 RepID=A0A4R8BK09_9ACTN|nr:RNA polymerase sigma factor [Kribbella pratensis]TDW54480.1 RNA polymerase sigma-70 factor (ECF subfamily) [Kribbella pratensis]